LLVSFGMVAVAIVVGVPIALIMALITKLVTGDLEGSPDFFAWGAFISPVLAFFTAKYALEFAASL
jgi:hypothetical protein